MGYLIRTHSPLYIPAHINLRRWYPRSIAILPLNCYVLLTTSGRRCLPARIVVQLSRTLSGTPAFRDATISPVATS
jgi:hypothetical protein